MSDSRIVKGSALWRAAVQGWHLARLGALASGMFVALSVGAADAARAVDAADVTGAEQGESPVPDEAGEGERVRVAASERYRAGRVHRFVLGGGYRDLWKTEIELPLLDLSTEGGGLTPTRRFGGLQTAVLGFAGADGRAYTFRGTDKDPSAVLDTILHDTIVQALVQDQMAAQHPGGPPVAAVLTDAAGVLTVHERMVVMPDDPGLGEFREEFAGMVGTFYTYPQAEREGREGFADALEIIDHEELYERLARDNETVVDVEAFLRARLVDLLLGDFDRHRKQWRWARLSSEPEWQPIPEDRDQAFVRYDGVAQRIMKLYIPILQEYGPEYPFVKGLTLHGWEQDRWLLPALSWPVWEATAADIQRRLTDDVIERAVAALPEEYEALDGERLAQAIRGRRDRLPEVTRKFYLHLAGEVNVQTSDASDRIEVERGADGSVEIRVTDPGSDRTVFSRRFVPAETEAVRLYLRGGEDEVVVRGARPALFGGIHLEVIAEKDVKSIDDREAGGTHIHDDQGVVQVLEGPGTSIDRRAYLPPPPDPGFVDVEDVPPRQWGSDTVPIPSFGYQPDVGVIVGAAVSHTRYGFRKHPWSSKHSLGFAWGTEASAPRLRYLGQFRPENSRRIAQLDFSFSGIEVLRFYNFGNETSDNASDKFFRVRNEQVRAGVNLVSPIDFGGEDERLRVTAGPYVMWSRTKNGVRLIDLVLPYGNNDFGIVGAEMQFQFDTRRSIATEYPNLELPFHDNPAAGYPTSGYLFEMTARYQPPVWDVDESYGSIQGSLAGFWSVGKDARATLALRVGGTETFGKLPYFDNARVGGGRFFSGDSTNRGFRQRRFIGDSAVFGNADLRVALGRVKVVVPGDIGIHGFFDVGRVFINDETSDNWHPSGGGGIWFSPLVRTNTISLSVARSPEDTLFYLRFGFHY